MSPPARRINGILFPKCRVIVDDSSFGTLRHVHSQQVCATPTLVFSHIFHLIAVIRRLKVERQSRIRSVIPCLKPVLRSIAP
jgi:hypothetical protein